MGMAMPPHVRGSNVKGPPGSTLFVVGFPEEWEDDHLWQLFAPYGSLLSSQVFKDKNTGQAKGYGFVSYDSPHSAQAAMQALQGQNVGGGRKLRIEPKNERR